MPTEQIFQDEWLLRLLVHKNLLSQAQVNELRLAKTLYLSTEILRKSFLSKEQIAQAIASQYGMSFIDPDHRQIDKMAMSLLPDQFCRKNHLVPWRLSGDNLELLMANPLDVVVTDEAQALSGRKIVAIFTFPDKIEELWAAVFGSDAVVVDLLKKLPSDKEVEWLSSEKRDDEDTKNFSISAPVIKLADAIIAQAVLAKASDIHIEHDQKATHVRTRVDGILRNTMAMPKHVGEGPLVSRIKIMANLDVANRRRPQDGRAKIKVGAEEVGLRVSTLPTAFGEKVVMRILDQRQAEIPLASLGFRAEILERIEHLSGLNQGMLLMTGPTGSGKTTTLYSILHKLQSADINIVTVEDPIEYRLEGINQVQVNDKAGLGFAAVLRSVLRQDPDIVLVGEIRDKETADIAFQAAQTGHMVFSTLHTNDSLSTVARLLDMGVERYKMIPALVGILAQRLARRVCDSCKKEMPLDHPVAALLKSRGWPAVHSKGQGCEDCGLTGMRGRLAITELLDLSDPKSRDRLNVDDEIKFRETALERKWLMTLEEDALWHLSHGNIPLNEALPFISDSSAAAAQKASPRKSAAPATVSASSEADRQPRKILVVDDSEDNRTLARHVLEKEGFAISEAENGAVALQEIAKEAPDLVLLDIMMPGLDGFGVLNRLRGEMAMPGLPVMVLTAISESDSQALTLDMGADDYLMKPFHPKVLKARVHALFRRIEERAGA